MTRLEQLQKLVALAPGDPMSHYGLGLEFINLNRWEEAAAAFSKAIEVDAKYSAAYYHKGRALIALGRESEARTTLTTGATAARAAGDWHTEGEMNALLDSIG